MPAVSRYVEFASGLSSRLAGMAPDGADDEIRRALRRIGAFFAVDCCAIFMSAAPGDEDGDARELALVHAIDAGCAAPAVQIPLPPMFSDALRHDRSIGLCTPADLPAAAAHDRAWLARCGIESLLLVPVSAGDGVDFIFLLAGARARSAWPGALVSQVRLLGGMLVMALCRSGARKAHRRTARGLAEAQRVCRLGSWEWDRASGRITAMDAVDRILGVRPDNLAAFVALVHEADRKLLEDAIEAAVKHPDPAGAGPVEYRIRTRRGDLRIVQSRFGAADCACGPTMSGTFHDVTGARRAEEELQLLRSHYWHADRIAHAGVLVASLAHELSQPLAAILSNAQAGQRFLSREPPDQQEIGAILADVVADIGRAQQIIDALRGMMRRNIAGRARIDASDIARDVLALLNGEFVAQQVEVELACGADCFVHANKTQIEQVLLNLMLNSIEAMRAQPVGSRRIALQVARKGGDEVQVSVSDSGEGIAQDQLGSVFEAFWTTKAHGVGMGLAVCRSIIEAHGGRIWAERNGDRGAVFLFRLRSAH